MDPTTDMPQSAQEQACDAGDGATDKAAPASGTAMTEDDWWDWLLLA